MIDAPQFIIETNQTRKFRKGSVASSNPHRTCSGSCSCHSGGGPLPVFDEREISNPGFSCVDR